MPFEIERKFLVAGQGWRSHVVRQTQIRQGYLSTNERVSVRVRIEAGKKATLTIKSRSAGLRRMELEYEIPTLEAEALLAHREGAVVEKTRHVVPWEGLDWEIDVFEGENAGLIVAEVELTHEQQQVPLPPWAGAEITDQPKFYNQALATNPYRAWLSEVPLAPEGTEG